MEYLRHFWMFFFIEIPLEVLSENVAGNTFEILPAIPAENKKYRIPSYSFSNVLFRNCCKNSLRKYSMNFFKKCFMDLFRNFCIIAIPSEFALEIHLPILLKIPPTISLKKIPPITSMIRILLALSKKNCSIMTSTSLEKLLQESLPIFFRII